MVSVVSGFDLGLAGSSAKVLGKSGVLGSASSGQHGHGVYVNAANGNLVVQVQDADAFVAGRTAELGTIRTYNSQGGWDGDNNDQWRISNVRRLVLNGTRGAAGSSVVVTQSDGSQFTHQWNASSKAYVTMAGDGAADVVVWHDASKSWRLTDGSTQRVSVFDGVSGRLIREEDTDGNTVDFDYDEDGRLTSGTLWRQDGGTATVSYTYGAAGTSGVRNILESRLQNTHTGGTILTRYTYDSANRLVSVSMDLTPDNQKDAKVYNTTYTYDGTSKRIASITQQDGSVQQFTYAQIGGVFRVSKVTEAVATGVTRSVSYTYDTTARTTTVTDALGLQTMLTYDVAGQLISIAAPAVGGVRQTVRFAYNASGDVISQTDASGKTTSYQYDAAGNLLQQRDAAGNTVSRTYGSRNELLSETLFFAPDPDGAGTATASQPATTRYVYDGELHLRFKISAEGRVTEHRYETVGTLAQTLEYTDSLFTVAGVPSETQLNAWVAGLGDKSRVQRTDYEADFFGNIIRETRYGFLVADGSEFFDQGGVEQTSVQYARDYAGRIISRQSAAGWEGFAYDGLGRLTSYTDGVGNTTTTTYDDVNNKITVLQADGLTRVSVFNRTGELLTQIESKGSTALATKRYSYDAAGRLRMVTSATGERSYMLYDEAGRKVADIEGDGSLVEYRYNANNQLETTLRFATLVSATALASLVSGDQPTNVSLASLRPAASAADRVSWTLYDGANRLWREVDAEGAVKEYFYDGASRLVRTVAYANRVTAPTAAAAPASSNTTAVANAAQDRITRAFYDADGKLRGELDAEGYLTEHRYNAAGQRVLTARYADATAAAQRAAGSLQQLMDGRANAARVNDITTRYVYDGRGLLRTEINGEGELTQYDYDHLGRLTATERGLKLNPATLAVPQTVALRFEAQAVSTPASGATPAVWPILQVRVDGVVVGSLTIDTSGWKTFTVNVPNMVSLQNHTVDLVYANDDGKTGATSRSLKVRNVFFGGARIDGPVSSGVYSAFFDAGSGAAAFDGAAITWASGDEMLLGVNGAMRMVAHSTAQLEAAAQTGPVQRTERSYDGKGQLNSERVYWGDPSAAGAIPLVSTNWFTYDAASRVVQSYTQSHTTGMTRQASFRYDLQGRLVGELGSEGTDWLNGLGGEPATADVDKIYSQYGTRHTYDAAGRRTSSTDALGNRTLYFYNADNTLAATINALGEVVEHTYDAFNQINQTRVHGTRLALTTVAAWSGGLLTAAVTQALTANRSDTQDSRTALGYTATGRLASQGQASSATTFDTTRFGYSAFGDLIRRETPTAGSSTVVEEMRFNRRGEEIERRTDTAAGGANITRSAIFDAFGRVIQTTDAKGAVSSQRYDRAGRIVQTTSAAGGTQSFTFDALGRELTRTDKRGNVTRSSYSKNGLEVTLTTPEGVSITTKKNGLGQVLEVVEANGRLIQYEYDGDGRLTFERHAFKSYGHDYNQDEILTLETRYDRIGQVIETVDALGVRTGFTYDAANRVLTRVQDVAGLKLTTRYTIDAKGQQIRETGPDGKVTAIAYDLKGQKLSVAIDPAGLNLRTEYAYDKRGNVVRVTEAAGTAAAVVTEHTFDAAGRRTRTTVDPAGLKLATAYTYDKNGNVLTRTEPNGAVTWFSFDVENRERYRLDATGVLTETRYDADGRVVRTIQYATLQTALLPTAAKPWTGVVSDAAIVRNAALDKVNTWAYDRDGRNTHAVNGVGAVTRNTFDANGNIIAVTQYANTIAISADPLAPINVTASSEDRITRHVFDTQSRRIATVDAAGQITAFEYDWRGNQVGVFVFADRFSQTKLILTQSDIDTATHDSTYSFAKPVHQATRRVFDAANRLIREVSPTGVVVNYTLDAAGRVVTQTVRATRGTPNSTNDVAANPADRITRSVYDAAGRRVSTEDVGATTRYSYDAAGRLRMVTSATGERQYSLYDSVGRKVADIEPDGSLVEYRYNANSQLETTLRYATLVSATALASLVVGDQPANVSLASIRPAASGADRVRWTLYDGASRLWREVDAEGAVTEYRYDSASRLVGTVAYAKRVTAPTSAVAPTPTNTAPVADAAQDRATRRLFDADGNLRGELDAEGYLTEHRYNAAGQRVLTVRYADITAAAQRAQGSLQQLIDGRANAARANDITSRYFYDNRGLLRAEINGEGELTQYTYDLFGRLINTDRGLKVNLATLGAPQTVVLRFEAQAVATPASGATPAVWPVVQVRVDGVVVQTLTVNTASWKAFTVNVPNMVSLQNHTVDLVYANDDGKSGNTSRSVKVRNVLFGGANVFGDPAKQVWNAFFDRGTAAAAFDDQSISWPTTTEIVLDVNGALRMVAASFAQVAAQAQTGPIQRVTRTYTTDNRVAREQVGWLDASGAAKGLRTEYTYDRQGRVIASASTDEISAVVRRAGYRYDIKGQLVGELGALGSEQLLKLGASPTAAQIDNIYRQYGTRHTYDAAGRRTSSTDALGNRTLYFYNADNTLAATINALGEVVEHTYDAFNQINQTRVHGTRLALTTLAAWSGGLLTAAVTQALTANRNDTQDSRTALGYTATGRLASQGQASSATTFDTTRFGYSAFGDLIRRETPTAGSSTVVEEMRFNRRGEEIERRTDTAAGGANITRSAIFDAFGRVIQTTDANGAVKTQRYDRTGRMVQTLSAAGGTQSFTFDAAGRELTRTDRRGNVTRSTYSQNGRDVKLTTAEGVSITTKRNAFGQVVEVAEANGRLTQYQYDTDGRLTTETRAGQAYAKTVYDRIGRAIETTDARGVRTSFAYDAANRVLTRTQDVAGLKLTTRYTIDAKGQQIRETGPDGKVTAIAYDLKGQKLSVAIDPAGLNLRTEYAYDKRGNVVRVTEAAGTAAAVVTEHTFDAAGRRTRTTVDPAGLKLATAYTYDKNGNVLTRTEPNGAVTWFSFDVENRERYRLDATGVLTETRYDADGRVVRAIQYATLQTALLPTAAKPWTGVVSDSAIVRNAALDRVQTWAFDRDGRNTHTVNGVGAVTRNTFDANGNIVAVTQHANTIAISADPFAPINVTASTEDRITRFVFDSQNRRIAAVDATGAVTRFELDANGNEVAVTKYANRISKTALALTLADITVAANAADRLTRRVFDAANRVIGEVTATGMLVRFTLDAAGRVVAETMRTTRITSTKTVLTAADINVAASAEDRITRFVFDAAGRKIAAVDAMGALTRYTWDAGSRLIAESQLVNQVTQTNPVLVAADINPAAHADDRITRHVYDAAGRKIAGVNALGDVTRFTLDSLGNVAAQTRFANRVSKTGLALTLADVTVTASADDRVTRAVFDVLGRQIAQVDALGGVTRFSFDAFGNIVNETRAVNRTSSAALVLGLADINVAAHADDRVTRHVFDAVQRNTYSVDALGGVTRRVFNAFGELTRSMQYANRISVSGVLTAAAIEAALTAKTDRRETLYTYDRLGRAAFVAQTFRQSGNTTEYTLTENRYDRFGQLSQTLRYATLLAVQGDSLPNTPAATEWTSRLTLNAAQDRNTQFTYDAVGRLLTETDAAGFVERHTYDVLGNKISTTNKLGTVWTFLYDKLGRLIAEGGPSDADWAHRGVVGYLWSSAATGRAAVYGVSASNGRILYTNSKTEHDQWVSQSHARSLGVLGYVETVAAGGTKALYRLSKDLIAGVGRAGNDYTTDAAEKDRLVSQGWRLDGIVGYLRTQTAAGALALHGAYSASSARLYFSTQASTANPLSYHKTNAYNVFGDVIARTEAPGLPEQRTTRYTYDALGRQIGIAHPDVSAYDPAADNPAANGESGPANRVERTVTPTVTTVYNSLGDAVSNRDIAGEQSFKVYDKLGNTRYEIDALGFVTRYDRNTFGEVTQLTRYAKSIGKNPDLTKLASLIKTDAADRVVTTSHDRAGRTIEVVEPQSFYYDANAAAGKQYFTTGKTTRTTFNAFGEATETRVLANPLTQTWATTGASLDAQGRVVKAIDAEGFITETQYDAFGQVIRTTEYAQRATAQGQPQASEQDRTARFEYDRMGRKITETRVGIEVGTQAGAVTRQDVTTRYGYDAQGNQISATDGQGNTTRSYYSPRGFLRALVQPGFTQTSSGAPVAPLTEFVRDAYGNEIRRIDYARGATAVTDTSYTVAGQDAADRVTETIRDRYGRALTERDALGFESYTSYDVRGNIAKTWRTVTDDTGRVRTLWVVNRYDALGRLLETVEPATTRVILSGVKFSADYDGRQMPDGNPPGSPPANRIKLSWAGLINAKGGMVRVEANYIKAALLFDEDHRIEGFGPGIEGVLTQDYAAASAGGGVHVLATTDFIYSVNYLRISQLTNGQWVTKWEGPPPSANGSAVIDRKQSEAGVAITTQTYNAFGEIVARNIDGSYQEYFDYDGAGKLWRTNSQDGVDKIALYDVLGNSTADIRSAGLNFGNLDLRTVGNAAQAAQLNDVRRTDTRYNLVGHLQQQSEPGRTETQGGVTLLAGFSTGQIISSAQEKYSDESGFQGIGGTNEVRLSWASLADLGSGEVEVLMNYRTLIRTGGGYFVEDESGQRWVEPWQSGGTARSRSGLFTAEHAAGGATFSWVESEAEDNGIHEITSLRVRKKDVSGNWVTLIETSSFGAQPSSLQIALPSNPTTTTRLQLKAAGTNTWWDAALTRFGSRLRFDAKGLPAGTYDYRVFNADVGQPERVTSTGQVDFAGNLAPGQNGETRNLRPTRYQTTDRWGNATQVSDPRNSQWVTSYRFNANNQVIEETKPDTEGKRSAASPVTRYYYDAMGRQVATTDARGNTTAQAYSALGHLVTTTQADGGVTRYRFNAFGNRTHTTDTLGAVTEERYDKMGRLIQIIRPRVSIWQVTGDNYVSFVNDGNPIETFTYDAAGRKLSVTNANNEVTRYRYDARGNVLDAVTPMGITTRWAYNARNQKILELDPTYFSSSWTYDSRGLLNSRTDIGGAEYTFTYDNARQLINQTSTRGQNMTRSYDVAGQLIGVYDAALGQQTDYQYDLAGRRVREKTTQGGVVYQDNFLAYDAQGYLRDVRDGRAHVMFDYDAVGNRSRIRSSFINNDNITRSADRYFQYDSMNRQTVVDGVDAAGKIIVGQGHKIGYDTNGNRISDTYWGKAVESRQVVDRYEPVYVVDESGSYVVDEDGNKIPVRDGEGNIITDPNKPIYRTDYNPVSAEVTDRYTYDALGRLTDVNHAGQLVDLRRYDAVGRVLKSGGGNGVSAGWLEAANRELPESDRMGLEAKFLRWDANGRMLQQNTATISIAAGEVGKESASRTIYTAYDAAGNLQSYRSETPERTYWYENTVERYDGYRQKTTYARANGKQDGMSEQHYDVNGNLIAIRDAKLAENNRDFVNDIQGRALWANQNGRIQRQLIVEGEVIARFGLGVDPNEPKDGNGMPRFAEVAEFYFGYRPITGSYPAVTVGAYTIAPGDTLESIARSVFGDARMWYAIAEANGLHGNRDLRVGQSITIPSRVAGSGNNATTFTPYDPGKITGDTSPHLPQAAAGKGCGGFGKILVLVIAAVVVFVVPQMFPEMMQALGSMAKVVTAAIGSVVSQTVAVAVGIQEKFSWKQVAFAALSAGMQEALGPVLDKIGLSNDHFLTIAARRMVQSAATQAVAVTIGLQESFSWRSVAASGISYAVAGDLPVVSSLISSAVINKGKIRKNDFLDAFGNALGQWMVGKAEEGLRSKTQLSAALEDGFRLPSQDSQPTDERPVNDPLEVQQHGLGTRLPSVNLGDGFRLPSQDLSALGEQGLSDSVGAYHGQNNSDTGGSPVLWGGAPAHQGLTQEELSAFAPGSGAVDPYPTTSPRGTDDGGGNHIKGQALAIKIGKKGSVLRELARQGLTEQQQFAMYGYYIRTGQITKFDAKGTPIVMPGQELYGDLGELGDEKLGRLATSREGINREILAEIKAQLARQTLASTPMPGSAPPAGMMNHWTPAAASASSAAADGGLAPEAPASAGGESGLAQRRADDQQYYNDLILNAKNPSTAVFGTLGRAFNNAGYDLAEGAVGLYKLATDSNAQKQLVTALANAAANPVDTLKTAYEAGSKYVEETSAPEMAEDLLRFGAGAFATAGTGKVATTVGTLSKSAGSATARSLMPAVAQATENYLARTGGLLYAVERGPGGKIIDALGDVGDLEPPSVVKRQDLHPSVAPGDARVPILRKDTPILRASPEEIYLGFKENTRIYAHGEMSWRVDGQLSISIRTYVIDGPNTVRVDGFTGSKAYDNIFSHFGDRVKSVRSNYESDNKAQFYKSISEGYSPQEAAMKTWSGQQMLSRGFTKVHVDPKRLSQGEIIAIWSK